MTTSAPTPTLNPTQIQTDGATTLHGFDEPRSYVVQPGDTLLTVALETGLDLDDVYCAVAPAFRREQPLVIGDVLSIPPASMRCHQVAAGETLAQIAAQYGVTPDAIVHVVWNNLAFTDTQVLTPGSHLRIPAAGAMPSTNSAAGADLAWMLQQPVEATAFVGYAVGGAKSAPVEAPVPENWPFGSGNFRWPTYGWLSQDYNPAHRALDIAAPLGTLVTAADRGVVIRAGWNDQGYGNFVVIDHNIDYVTLYGHLSEIFVTEGQVVAPGQPLGRVGSTGNSTGPHLHFEIRDFGRLTDPIPLLVR
ncbi:MAG: M23 family metallopeptidase [Caldilineaceae bacterium]